MHSAFAPSGIDATPIHLVTSAGWPRLRERLTPAQTAFAEAAGFEPKAGRHLLVPGDKGLASVLFAADAAESPERDSFSAGRLPALLPAGTYRLVDAEDARLAALAFALGTYKFGRYRKA